MPGIALPCGHQEGGFASLLDEIAVAHLFITEAQIKAVPIRASVMKRWATATSSNNEAKPPS